MSEHLMQQLAVALGDLDVTVREHEDDWYVSIPTGYQTAIEIDYVSDDPRPFQLWDRAWDRTGGLSRDSEIGSAITVADAVHAVCRYLTEQLDWRLHELDQLTARQDWHRRLVSQYLQEV